MPKQQKPSATDLLPVPLETVARRIHLIRGKKVMLDSDLAGLYQVETRALNQAVRRNAARFPEEDFMFQLTAEEMKDWMSQIVISNPAAKMALRKPPLAFTELGVAMLSSVLNSDRAVQMNIAIMRAFVHLRELLATSKEFAARLEKLETGQKQHASVLALILDEIKKLKQPPTTPPKRRIGFYDRRGEEEKK